MTQVGRLCRDATTPNLSKKPKKKAWSSWRAHQILRGHFGKLITEKQNHPRRYAKSHWLVNGHMGVFIYKICSRNREFEMQVGFAIFPIKLLITSSYLTPSTFDTNQISWFTTNCLAASGNLVISFPKQMS